MGIYGLIFLFLGILLIGLVWAKTDQSTMGHHVLFAVILFVFLVIFFVVHHHVEKTCVILIAGDLDRIIGLIRSWGVAAPMMSILLMITQALVAPLPAILVTAANGMIFGPFWGAVLSWSGALLAAMIAFYIARLFREVALGKIVRSEKAVEFMRHAGEKKGLYVILLSRLLPFISFDIISYMAGLSGIRVPAFIMGTAVGMLPATITYSLIGHNIPELEKRSPILLTCTVVFIFILIVVSLVRGIRFRREAR